jgi:hypothetical protein
MIALFGQICWDFPSGAASFTLPDPPIASIGFFKNI